MEIRLRALLPLLLFIAVAGQRGAAEGAAVTGCNLSPALSLGNDTTVCEGYLIDAGAQYVNYLWHDGSTGRYFAADFTGYKYVSVTDSFGCTGSDTIYIEVLPGPTASVTPFGTVLLCTGDTIVLSALNPSIHAYLWNDSVTSGDHYVFQGGDYWVIVYDSLGCTDTSDVVRVNEHPKPVINFDPLGPYEFCEGDSIYLSVRSNEHFSYQWNDGITSADRHIHQGGNYYVVVYDSSGCFDTSQVVTITEWPSPVVNLGPDTTVCEGTSVQLSAGSGFASYLWGKGQTTPSITSTLSGTHSVIVTDSRGCKGGDEMVISHLNNPPVDLGPDIILCGETDTFILDAGPDATSYQWSTGDTTQTITVTTTGSYSVTVTRANGCSRTSGTKNIVLEPKPDVPITWAGTDLTTSAFSAYQWFFNGDTIQGATSMTYHPMEAGDYHVLVTTTSGCIYSSDTLRVLLILGDIPQGFSPNGDGVNDVWEIPGINAYPNNSLVIFNRWGNEVFNKKPYLGNWNGQSSAGKDLEDATYFYKLDLGDGKGEVSGYVMIRR